MTYSIITVLLLFVITMILDITFRRYQKNIREKYSMNSWQFGYFVNRKVFQLLTAEDKLEWDAKLKKLNRFKLLFIIYTVSIFMLSGIVFNGKL